MNFEEWVEKNGIHDCNFIKMDIEGGEYRVLPTMVSYLKRVRPTLHLSMHPCFLGNLRAQGAIARFGRSLLRLRSTIRLLSLLNFYKFIYSPSGRCPDSPHRHWTLHILSKVSWKPLAQLLACLYAVYGGANALVFTDQRW